MAESPFKDFIDKLPPERKPLSEAERKESMMVGRELWKKGMQYYVEGLASACRGLEDDSSSTTIFINNLQHEKKGVREELLQHPDTTDLVISLVRRARDRITHRTSTAICDMDVYEFSPGEITKLERRNVPLKGVDEYERIGNKLIASPIMSKDAMKARAQETRERYEPNKEELRELLDMLALSKPASFFIKHSRYPA